MNSKKTTATKAPVSAFAARLIRTRWDEVLQNAVVRTIGLRRDFTVADHEALLVKFSHEIARALPNVTAPQAREVIEDAARATCFRLRDETVQAAIKSARAGHMPNVDPDPNLRGKALIEDMIAKQKLWIEWCDANGTSYAGVNGPSIREADEAALHNLEERLARLS